jgi:hypothetical protein
MPLLAVPTGPAQLSAPLPPLALHAVALLLDHASDVD